MRDLPQQEHADLGIVPDQDQTEDLRSGQGNALDGVGAPAEGELNTHQGK